MNHIKTRKKYENHTRIASRKIRTEREREWWQCFLRLHPFTAVGIKEWAKTTKKKKTKVTGLRPSSVSFDFA